MLVAATDRNESTRYRNRLEEVMLGRVLDRHAVFCCRYGPKCRESVGRDGFAAGQLSYVGDHYAVTSAGSPFRILVVSMQVGDDEAPVTFARRREQIRDRIPEPFRDRNQHMAGVTTALRVLLGGEPGEDADDELIHTANGRVHVLDAYAMANSVLCSRRPAAGREGAPSALMISNCSENLQATIQALDPTIIQSQGRGKAGTTHQAVERVVDHVEQVSNEVARVRIGRTEAVWCSLKHPARNWGQLGRRYLHEVAFPALKITRQIALARNRDGG